MRTFQAVARPPTGAITDGARPFDDPDLIASFLEDAAHHTGGRAAAIAFPRTEADVAALMRSHARLLPVGAQSSLTGGATPMDDLVLSTARLSSILEFARDRVRVQAGVPLAALQDALARERRYYPPAPTFNGAFVGGTAATNAAGAATFKYGTTREWVEALTVVLASGEALDLARGDVRAHPDGYFEIVTAGSVRRVGVPSYRMPEVPKRSAGYFAAPDMDLIDLFVGSEGTLGVITELTLRILPSAPAVSVALVPLSSDARGFELVAALRAESQATWRSHDPRGLDVSAIEYLDRRCLELVREDGSDRRNGVALAAGATLAILVQLELPDDMTQERAFEEVASARDPAAPDTPLVRFCRLLDRAGAFDDVEIALPGDGRRAAQLVALREAVPAAVNLKVGIANRMVHAEIAKTAADMIVPFERFAEMMQVYRDGFGRRGLDYAIWGHVSDGNVHPNVIPRSIEDVRAGREAILEFGREAARLGGCPLAEHGVGRSPVKQALLRQLYGDRGIEEMRAVKRALDPEWKLAAGVLFS